MIRGKSHRLSGLDVLIKLSVFGVALINVSTKENDLAQIFNSKLLAFKERFLRVYCTSLQHLGSRLKHGKRFFLFICFDGLRLCLKKSSENA